MVVSREPVTVDAGAGFDSVPDYVREQEEEQEQDVLAGLREIDGADSARWRIYRVGADDPSMNGFLDEIGTEQVSATYIRDKFGGGKYKLRCHLPNGRIAAHRKIEIAGDAPVKIRPVDRMSQAQPAATALPGSPGFTWEQYEARQEAQRERARRERNEMIALMGPIVAPIVAAMIGNKGPDITGLVAALKGPSVPEMLVALKSLTPEAPKQPDTFSNIDKLIDVAERLGGGNANSGETSFTDVLKELARSAGPSLGNLLEGAMSRGASVAALPAPNATPTNVAHPEDPQMLGALALLPWLKSQMTMAIEKAVKNKDASLVAERILDDLPDGVAPQDVLNIIGRADWWAQLTRFAPAVAAHGPWFATMREEMLTILREETAPASMKVTPVVTPPVTIDGTNQSPPSLGPKKIDDGIDRPSRPPSLTGDA